MTVARRRRIMTVAATGVSGTGLLWAGMSAGAGSRQFYIRTTALAGLWAAGALGSGPVSPDRPSGQVGTRPCGVVRPVLAGAGAFGVSYGAARLARRVPALNRAISSVLGYAEHGSVPLVMLIASANAVAEELYFRGALWSLAEESHPFLTTTVAYAATTAATRNPALVLAGIATSALFGLQRRTCGSVVAPALSHVTWSLLMLHYLPPLFRTPPASSDPAPGTGSNREAG